MNATNTQDTERQAILDALSAWIRQRPGLEYRNYASDWRDTEGRKAYFSELRRITRQLHDARELLAAVASRQSITADDLKRAFRAYSGRLTWTPDGNGGGSLDYCTGQYWPTEYRAAACAVLASALWDYYRSDLKPTGGYALQDGTGGISYDTYTVYGKKGLRFREAIQRSAKMGAGLSRSAMKWMD